MLLRSIISILYSKQQFFLLLFILPWFKWLPQTQGQLRSLSTWQPLSLAVNHCYYGFDHYEGPRKEVRSLNCCRFNLKVTESRKEVRSLNLGENTLIHCNALFSDCFLPWLIYTILRQTHESKFAIYQFFMPMKILLRWSWYILWVSSS